MRYKYGIVHGTATCEDCGWRTESYKNAQAIAAIHARRYKHHVVFELGIVGDYFGGEE